MSRIRNSAFLNGQLGWMFSSCKLYEQRLFKLQKPVSRGKCIKQKTCDTYNCGPLSKKFSGGVPISVKTSLSRYKLQPQSRQWINGYNLLPMYRCSTVHSETVFRGIPWSSLKFPIPPILYPQTSQNGWSRCQYIRDPPSSSCIAGYPDQLQSAWLETTRL